MLEKLLLLMLGITAAHANWSYDGADGPTPDKWSTNGYPDCGGQKQSPVNLRDAQIGQYPPLNLRRLSKPARGDIKFENVGHTVELMFGGNGYGVSGGGLSGRYQVEQVHFHWGANSSRGSEHQVNGHAFPLEMHVVAHSKKYRDVASAAQQSRGLAVFAVLFEVGEENTAFKKVTDKIKDIINLNSEVDIADLTPADLLQDVSKDKFYTYSGSLTTPGCFESVVWTVFSSPVQIAEAQLAEFRKVKMVGGSKMVDNFRPVQPLNGRKIYRSKP